MRGFSFTYSTGWIAVRVVSGARKYVHGYQYKTKRPSRSGVGDSESFWSYGGMRIPRLVCCQAGIMGWDVITHLTPFRFTLTIHHLQRRIVNDASIPRRADISGRTCGSICDPRFQRNGRLAGKVEAGMQAGGSGRL
jgi:hypothetical protein